MEEESAAHREERLQALWRQLDTKRKGYLDIPALKSGLAQMNHRKYFSVYKASSSGPLGMPKAVAAGRISARRWQPAVAMAMAIEQYPSPP